MSRLSEVLNTSRVSDLIGKIERGESVDYGRELTLQALDVARVGELFVLDAMDAEREADERFERQLHGD